MIVKSKPMEENQLLKQLECLLFVAPDTTAISHLADTLGITEEQTAALVQTLDQHYQAGSHGLRVMQYRNRVQLTTAPDESELIERFLGLETTTRLSQAALETLAIIAYKQPMTRPDVDSIRGVNSDGVMRSLLAKGLVEEMGRAETPGRPIFYGTTPAFLQYFGLASLSMLPPVDFEALKSSPEDKAVELLKE